MSAAGRFAPSPTGPLHFGSLLAATASYLDARSRGERWLLRMDDLDVHRNVPGAEAAILHALEAHSLSWDGSIVRQSERLPLYEHALETLARRGLTFHCTCSRRSLKATGPYPGTCRSANRDPAAAAVRVRVDGKPVAFTDLIAGPRQELLADTLGDFIIRRRDGLVAYQLATAVDDGDRDITRVVRGSDLLSNTARQIYLMRLLELSPPEYAHVPVLLNDRGQKLSKQTHAPALDNSRPAANLLHVLPALALKPPAEFESASAAAILSWAADNFSISAINPAGRKAGQDDDLSCRL